MTFKKTCIVVLLVGVIIGVDVRSFAQTTNVRVAFNGFGGIAPIYLGQDVGIFKKQGLNLEMIFIPGGSLSLQALIGKSLEILMTGGPPVVNAYLARRQDQNHRRRDELVALHFCCDGGHSQSGATEGKEDRHQPLWQQYRLRCPVGVESIRAGGRTTCKSSKSVDRRHGWWR